MSDIQKTIAAYMSGKTEPGVVDMMAFVGMIEDGEATYADFEAVGGNVLVAAVAKSMQNMEDARN